MHRLEQVRLPHPVRAHDQDEARPEVEVEPLVRADGAQRDPAEKRQPASLIGMIRYWKSSSSERIRPGRSGLMRRRSISSASTDSTPSRRNSALNPISSGSPVNGAGIVSRASPR